MNKHRELRGIEIFQNGHIQQVDSSTFIVRSQSNKQRYYTVTWKRMKWVCDCKDYTENHKKCKHIHAVYYYLSVDRIKLGINQLSRDNSCPQCGKTTYVVKRGKRYNCFGVVQRFHCKECNRRFTLRKAFKGMKHRADIIALALDLYYRGLSLRQISQHLNTTRKITVSHGTIFYWIKKYVALVTEYLQSLPAASGTRWHADETVLKVQGRHLQLWSLLDSETRFLLAMHISEKRGVDEAQELLRKGVKKSLTKPLEIVTDGLSSYGEAIKEEVGTNELNPVIHLTGSLTKAYNNKIEKFNGTIKNRFKTMSGLQNEESAERFAKGFSIHYNFVREHSALNNKTPAQLANITSNKCNWLNLILQSQEYNN